MSGKIRPVWAEIDFDALENNMREIRRVSKSKEVMAVVKADAYGHGAVEVAPVLLKSGADRLAVAIIDEAVELRNSGIEAPIMILGFTSTESYEELLDYNLEQAIYSFDMAEKLSKQAIKKNKIARIHIKVDTGMGRIGFLLNDKSIEDICKIKELPNIEIVGMFTHLSTADEADKTYSNRQIRIYNEFYEKLKEHNVNIKFRHISNSAAIIDMPEVHYEGVRPGIILYGYYPSEEVKKDRICLKPIMSVKAKVAHVKVVPEGQYISYGRKYRTTEERIIATLPIGYADGFTRLCFNKGKVIINGKYAPVVGRICMDQCMVDVTDVGEVKVGDEAIIIGKAGDNSITADDIAREVGTISYEVLCAVSKRVPRVYLKNGTIVKVKKYI